MTQSKWRKTWRFFHPAGIQHAGNPVGTISLGDSGKVQVEVRPRLPQRGRLLRHAQVAESHAILRLGDLRLRRQGDRPGPRPEPPEIDQGSHGRVEGAGRAAAATRATSAETSNRSVERLALKRDSSEFSRYVDMVASTLARAASISANNSSRSMPRGSRASLTL